MSTPTTLPISTSHVVRQFSRRADLSDAQFLYGEIAQRMAQRLRLVRLTPANVLDAGCGAGQQFERLHERYPQARYLGQDHNPDLLAYAKNMFNHSCQVRYVTGSTSVAVSNPGSNGFKATYPRLDWLPNPWILSGQTWHCTGILRRTTCWQSGGAF